MKNKIVIALLCSLTITASTIGSAAVISADMRGPGQEMSIPGEPQNSPTGEMPEGMSNGQMSDKQESVSNRQKGEMPEGTPNGQTGDKQEKMPNGQTGDKQEKMPNGQTGDKQEKMPNGQTGDKQGRMSNDQTGNKQQGEPGSQNGSMKKRCGDTRKGMQTPPEKPEGTDSTNRNTQTPPEKPEGTDSTNGNMQAPPEKPEGTDSTDGNKQTPPEKPEGTDSTNGNTQGEAGQTGTFGQAGSQTEGTSGQAGSQTEGIPGQPGGQEGVSGQPGGQEGMPGQPGAQPEGVPGQSGAQPEGMSGQPGGQPGGMPGASSQPTEYSAANKLEEDSKGMSYDSTAGGESAVLVDGKEVSISGTTVSKTGDSNGEDSDFYGTNAAVLAVNGGTLSIDDADITTDGAHANGVFSYGEGTTVNISDSAITTTGNNSGGLMTTGGGTMNATNLTVNTSGNSSASIRSDRGGGTVNVDKGSYSTAGVGSPAIYSTADITVSDATLSATNSEAVVIEGGNSVTLSNVNATGNNASLNGQSTVKTNVLIYQSMSGDASEGKSAFSMTGGSLTSLTGTMFHVTNTTTTIDLSGVDFTYADDSDDFIVISEDSWGRAGSNGGHVTLNLDAQAAEGNALVDQSSDLALNLTNGSTYTGAVNSSNSGAEISVSIDEGSTWTLTGDSYITSFDGSLGSVISNGYHLYVNGTVAA